MIPLIAVALWLLLAVHCVASRTPLTRRGLRRSELHLLIGTLIVAIVWLAEVDFRAPAATASAIPMKTPRASCASLDTGMTRGEVLRRMGDPDENRSDEETRGPGATALVYRASRCTVRLFDDRVEFVD
ncbi:MAG TPA: hypothetical protein VNA69_09465 [Thermoanaerobaculia bacterium]|nr:hypothetical protein [Thermoanaerobaculia bacterium]